MKRTKKILIANSIGVDDNGNNFILFPSRWSASVGKTKSFNYYPYELAYLSSLLKKKTNHKIRMVDGNLEKLTWKEYFKKYSNFKPDYLVMETSSAVYKYDLMFALSFKKKYGTKIIFCGQHPTAYPLEVKKGGADFVCVGEYEMTVLDIIEGKKNVLGLYPNKRRPLINLDELPNPEDDDIKRVDYMNIGGSNYREVELFPTRGCPMNCVFCVARQLYYDQPNFRKRSINNVIEEIKYISNKYSQVEGFFFDEENHNADKKYVLDLCKAIIKNKLNNYHYEAMCGYWTIDEEMLDVMKQAGYYKLRIGIETASVKTSKGMVKNINIDKLVGVLEMAKKYGIKMYGTFTFGAPESNKEEDNKTLLLIEKLLKEDLLEDFQASICTPQPGTPFFQYLEKNKYLLTKNWEDYSATKAVYEYPDYKKTDIESNIKQVARIYFRHMLRKNGALKLIIDQIRKDGVETTFKKAFSMLNNFK
ncbi:MAG TPA: radical SAM protein [Candidatus Woesebacteria bacterium]|mgnify:CR=1 FL=1|nr:radical SAM protein [Candidatus Woesebacteria bacterium]